MKNYKILYAFILAVGAMLFSCELDPDFDPNAVPTINNLSISSPAVLSCQLPCSVTFTAMSTLDFPNSPTDQVTYTWDFGDGSITQTGNNIIYEYTDVGNYDVTLVATASGAIKDSITESFIVNPNSTFSIKSTLDDIAYDVLEVDDGFIVFGSSMNKFDKTGFHLVQRFPNTNIYADYADLGNDNYVVVGHYGNWRTFDKNINFNMEGATRPGTSDVIALREELGVIEFIGNAEQAVIGSDSIFGFQPGFGLFDFSAIAFDVMPDYISEQYFPISISPQPGFRPHFQFEDEIYLTLNNGDILYKGTSDENLFWPLGDLRLDGLVEGEGDNLLAIGSNISFYDINRTNGSITARSVLCESGSETVGGFVSVDDGFVIASNSPNDSACASALEFEKESEVVLRKVDKDLNLVWERILPTDDLLFPSVEFLKTASDGGFIIGGYGGDPFNTYISNMFLVKTNSEGIVN